MRALRGFFGGASGRPEAAVPDKSESILDHLNFDLDADGDALRNLWRQRENSTRSLHVFFAALHQALQARPDTSFPREVFVEIVAETYILLQCMLNGTINLPRPHPPRPRGSRPPVPLLTHASLRSAGFFRSSGGAH